MWYKLARADLQRKATRKKKRLEKMGLMWAMHCYTTALVDTRLIALIACGEGVVALDLHVHCRPMKKNKKTKKKTNMRKPYSGPCPSPYPYPWAPWG